MKRSTVAAALVAAALALTACAPSAPPEPTGTGASAGTGPSDKTMSIGTTSDVVNFNPVLGNSRTDSWVTNLMYPHLLSIDEDGAKEPFIAEKWGYVDDTTGYYEIKKGLTWSDGQPLTAEDVAWTLNAVKRDKAPGTFFGQLGNLDVATAVSDTRIEMKLLKPDASIVEEIGFWGVVVPKHVFEPKGSIATFANDGKDGGWVGLGPFVMKDFQVGQHYTLERVEDYPLVKGGVPGPAKVVFRVYPDINTEILALQSGEIDVIANALPPAQVEKLKSAQGLQVLEAPGLGYAHMTYNMDNPDLKKTEVRRALAHAVDYDAIRSVVLQGQAVSTQSSAIMPVLSKYFDKSITPYAYDPDEARKLMEKAGYTADSSGTFPVTFTLIYSLQDSVTSQWAQMVKDGAAKAGITIDLKGAERNTYLSMTNEGAYDIYAGNFAIMDDPATNFSLSYLPGGAINYTHVDDPTLNALIEKAMVTFDEKERIGIMQEANKIVHDEVYDNVMYTQNLFFAASDKWTGFIPKPSELLSIVNPVSLASATPAG